MTSITHVRAKEYRTIMTTETGELNDAVNILAAEGWRMEHFAVTSDGGVEIFVAVMVREIGAELL